MSVIDVTGLVTGLVIALMTAIMASGDPVLRGQDQSHRDLGGVCWLIFI